MAIRRWKANVETPATVVSPRVRMGEILIEFANGETHTIVRRQDGVYAIVAPVSGEVTIQSVTPATTAVSDPGGQNDGRTTNGAMVDPPLGDKAEGQGFDSQVTNGFPYNAARTVSFPVTLSVGQSLVCSISDPLDGVDFSQYAEERWGVCNSYATFQVVASAPSEDSFAPPAVTWTGKSTDMSGDIIDVGAFVDSLPSYSTANQSVPSFDTIYDRINRHAPVGFMYPNGTYSYRVYQALLPTAFNGDISQTNANHGQFAGETVSLACLALISDGFTRDEKIKIATALISHGIQWSDPMYLGDGGGYSCDGGHFQVMQGAIAAARAARGLDLSDFTGRMGGNWKACFQVAQADLDKLAPHDTVSGHPTFSRKRLITGVSGNTVTVATDQDGPELEQDYIAIDFTGMILTRVSDGATANVTGGFSRNGANTTISGTVDDATGFAVDDVVYFQPGHTIQIGDYEWQDKSGMLIDNRCAWFPVNSDIYKNQQSWAGAVMLCRAAGWLSSDPLFYLVAGYTHTAMSPNMPTASVDYPDVAGTGWERQFFTEHGTGSTGIFATAPTTLVAPTISGSVVAGQTVTFTEGVYSGIPAPTVTRTLTLDGVDVAGDMNGLDYTIPSDAAGKSLVRTETATNGVSPDATQTITETVLVDTGVTGGTVANISDGGTDYRVHTFAADGTLEVSSSITIEHLLVAGGAGGGASRGGGSGGGGAGGFQKWVSGEADNTGSQLTLTAGTYTITIGAAGLGGTDHNASSGGDPGTNGGDTTAFGITVVGGGGGGSTNTSSTGPGIDGAVGGSGGGGAGAQGGVNADNTSAGGAGTAGQGFAGGDGNANTDSRNGGGGGGAGAAGQNGTDAAAGNGGDGIQTAISGTSTYYAGGGAGGVLFNEDGTSGTGGLGGGGDGGSGDGAAATSASGYGSGGGGSGHEGDGGDGTPGIVIIRYSVTIITATTEPVTQSVSDGDTWGDLLLASATDTTNYDSIEGAITSAVAEVSTDGGSSWTALIGNETTVLNAGESAATRVTVSDDQGNSRLFSGGSETVSGTAPAVTASDSLSSRTLTITVDTLTGTPTPSLALTALTLDGVNVLADATGADPWAYEVPSSSSAQTVAWTVEASNFEGTDTSSGSEAVPANLFAPTATTAPSIGGTIAPEETVTITEGTYSGTPAPTISGTLTLDGVDVTADMVGLDYTIPAGTDGQDLVWSETATNGVSPDSTRSVSGTVSATPAVAGGTITDINAGGQDYRVHTFTANGTLEVSESVTVEHLLVAGGGASGAISGGGGGGGGGGGVLKYVAGEAGNGSQLTLTAGTYSIVVGDGGQAGTYPLGDSGTPGTNGGDTTAFGLTAIGGGYGGVTNTGTADPALPGNDGASGGGGAGAQGGVNSFNTSVGGAGTSGQGFDGGDGNADSSHRNGGGGGGAGSAGLNGATAGGGDGGDGVESSISGSSSYYGGGGGGGCPSSSHGTPGSGGLGGGGVGSNSGQGLAGADGTGGGAGGSGHQQDGADGGSGIVIIRYQV